MRASIEVTAEVANILERVWKVHPLLRGDNAATLKLAICALARESEALNSFYSSFQAQPATPNLTPLAQQTEIPGLSAEKGGQDMDKDKLEDENIIDLGDEDDEF